MLGILYSLTIPSGISTIEKNTLASGFKFNKLTMYEPAGTTPASIRHVHPQYEHIRAWISSVGASVAITDIDGDFLPNDLIHVDPRYDQVFVEPVPGTINEKHHYLPYTLNVKSLPYNASTMAPTGVLANDFNEDGKMDVLVYYWGRTPVIFYQTENGFVENELLSTSVKYNSNAGILADFDGDGHTDILIGNYFPDESRVLDANATDNNQVMQHSMSRGDNGSRNRMFLWKGIENGKAEFEEAKDWDRGIENPLDWTLALAAADIDGDQLPEIYIANDFGPDKLLYNISTPGHPAFKSLKGVKHLTTISSAVLGKDSYKGMGVTFADINNDGLLDIYVSNIAEEFSLFESHFCFICNGEFGKMKDGIAPYTNKSEEMGLSRSYWGWDSKLADFNNDGTLEALQATGFIKGETNRWPELQELAMANDEMLPKISSWPKFTAGTDISGNAHMPFFVKSKSGKYVDIAPEINLGDNQIMRGIAIADVDHDGDLDFATANQWQPSHFYRNDYRGRNSFLGLTVLFPIEKESLKNILVDSVFAGRYAIGAEVKIKLPDGTTRVSFVDGGNGHSGKNSSEVFFGLGESNNATIDVEIKWRKRDGNILVETITTNPGWHAVALPY